MSISFIICERGMLLGKKESQKAMLSEHYFLLEEAGPGGRQGGPKPLIFSSLKTSVFPTDTQSRFAPVVLDGVLGPLFHVCHTLVSLYLCRSQSNVCVKDEGP